jgi:hypothetical protein
MFPAEKYGAAGDDFVPKTYNTDPTKPIGNWKEAWEKAKKGGGLNVDSMICDTLAAHGCLREVSRILSWRQSWAGVLPRQFVWPNVMDISASPSNGRQSNF